MDKIKFKIHIPTEQFGFIESEVEGSVEGAIMHYRDMHKQWHGGEGLSEDEFRTVLDQYLLTTKMESGDYEQMNKHQMFVIQTLKKAFKRIKNKDEDNSN